MNENASENKYRIQTMVPSVSSPSPHKTYNEIGKTLHDRLGQIIGKEHYVHSWLVNVQCMAKTTTI